jgi:hypothetical protein
LFAIVTGLICERLELPFLTGTKLASFSVENDLQRWVVEIKLAHEAATRSECKQMMIARGGREHHHAVEGFRIRRRGEFVVFGVGVVAEIDWLAQRAAGLREHLEALAVEFGASRK